MIAIRPSADRGLSHLGWLRSYHTFSFGEFYDPQLMGFRSLRVINEDYVAPAKGFGAHEHRDMEIITYVIDGALEHQDSMGHKSVLKSSETQVMSAGSGIEHSEFNHSSTKEVHFLQIWIKPSAKNISPRYEQKSFDVRKQRNRLLTIASEKKEEGMLLIHQDVILQAGFFEKDQKETLRVTKGRHLWIQIIHGKVLVNNQWISDGDGAAVSDETEIKLQFLLPTELLVFDLN
jgi:redox-sensitive bicupin YhaK (pirin superfamily)